jgi:hypothetical protein
MNTVIVYPTGVYGYGKAREYPTPQPDFESAWGYAVRCAFTRNPKTGERYVPIGIIGSFIYATPRGSYAETVDGWLYPEEYWDAAEAARHQRIIDDQTQQPPPGTGPYPIEAIDQVDAAFLNWLSTWKPKYTHAWLELTHGSWLAITQKMALGRALGGFDPETYSGPLQQVVLQVYGADQG